MNYRVVAALLAIVLFGVGCYFRWRGEERKRVEALLRQAVNNSS
jgi:hypothetical protein